MNHTRPGSELDETNDRDRQRRAPTGGRAAVQPYQPTPLTRAGRVANRIAGSRIFERYLPDQESGKQRSAYGNEHKVRYRFRPLKGEKQRLGK
jgi:hypothetical protein